MSEDYIEQLKNRDPRVRGSAIKKLGESKDERAVPALMEVLKEINWDMQTIAAEALGSIGKPAVPVLIDALKDDNEDVRWSAAHGLVKAENGTPGSVKLEDVQGSLKEFIDGSKDKENARREAAVYYIRIADAVRQGKEKISMPGELLPDKPKPPKGTFRRRVAHV